IGGRVALPPGRSSSRSDCERLPSAACSTAGSSHARKANGASVCPQRRRRTDPQSLIGFMARAFIGIGSNIDPEKNIRQALRQLAQAVRLTAISTFYREPALERPDEPAFYNGVVAVETDLPPARLKQDLLRKIEADLGRRRSSDKFASRPIDLDLLLYDD